MQIKSIVLIAMIKGNASNKKARQNLRYWRLTQLEAAIDGDVLLAIIEPSPMTTESGKDNAKACYVMNSILNLHRCKTSITDQVIVANQSCSWMELHSMDPSLYSTPITIERSMLHPWLV
jgi:hypothetical protein